MAARTIDLLLIAAKSRQQRPVANNVDETGNPRGIAIDETVGQVCKNDGLSSRSDLDTVLDVFPDFPEAQR